MRKLLPFVIVAMLLGLMGLVGWRLAGLPPAGMVWRHGLSYDPTPTGQVTTLRGIEFVEISPGCFLMGSARYARGGDLLGRLFARLGLPWGNQPGSSTEMPIHWVEFPDGFWIARREVTNEQYEAFAPEFRRYDFSPGDRHPAVGVSWAAAKDFCDWLARESGLPVRLPSESEWDCACRAGGAEETAYPDDVKELDRHAWHPWNSGRRAHEVGTREPNAWGLCDLHGNAWEWCEDTFHGTYDGAPTDGSAWTEGGEFKGGSPSRVIRGGGWCLWALGHPFALRFNARQGRISSDTGFRPAFTGRLKD